MTIKCLTSQAWILLLITATKPLANTITVYTDDTSKGRAGYIIYSPVGTCTEQRNIATQGATAQHAEILAVLAVLQALPGPVNIVSDSQYVVKTINSIETARLKGDPNSTISSYSHRLKWFSGSYFSIFYYSYPFTYRPVWPYG
jgi:cellulose synthase/poly-beta-1,6-N-acetylglucosamine synthase-like glycosyltransferase